MRGKVYIIIIGAPNLTGQQMSNFWVQFFKDAGIPSAAVRSYASIFEENRITKDMLLDLNKEILLDMGIKVMGDLISILKHAKKVYNQDLKRKERFGLTTTDTSQSVAQIPAVSTTVTAQTLSQEDSCEDILDLSANDAWAHQSNVLLGGVSRGVGAGDSLQSVGDVERHHPVVVDAPSPHHGTLRSDQTVLVTKQLRARGGAGDQEQCDYQEEYTTATFESRRQRKRGMYADEMEVAQEDRETAHLPKQTRQVVIPRRGVSKSPSNTMSPRQSSLFSQRVLELAGLHSRSGLDSSRVVQPSQSSVFQRLDRSVKAVKEHSGGGRVTRDITMVEAKRSKQEPKPTTSRLVLVRAGYNKASQPEATMVADKVGQKTTVHMRVDRTKVGARKGGASS